MSLCSILCRSKLLGTRVRGMRGKHIEETVTRRRRMAPSRAAARRRGSLVTGIGMEFGRGASKARSRLVTQNPCYMGIPLAQWEMRWYVRALWELSELIGQAC